MDVIAISNSITARESRSIVEMGLRMQFDALDPTDINYLYYVNRLIATALKYGLYELAQEFENDK